MNTAVTITTTTRTGSTVRMRTQSGLCANKGLLGHLCNLALDDELLQPRLGPLAQLQLLQHLNRRVALRTQRRIGVRTQPIEKDRQQAAVLL